MVSLVFIIGTLNLVLGFALAVALGRGVVLYLPAWGLDSSAAAPARAQAAGVPEPGEPPEAQRDAGSEAGLSSSSCGPLAVARGVAWSDDTLGALQRDIHLYIDTLLHLEDQIRHAAGDPHLAVIHVCVEQLTAACEEWLTRQCTIVRTMAEMREQWGPHADIERRLERMLLDQSPALEASCRMLAALNVAGDVDTAAHLVNEVILRLRDAHQLRDGVQEAFASLALRGSLAEPLHLAAHADPLTGLSDRMGLALLCRTWSDAAEDGEVRAVALLDLDDFGRANQLLGTRAADELLQAVGELLQREFEQGEVQVGRFSGQQFLLLWPDGDPERVSRLLERLLEYISEAPFSCAGQAYRLSARCGLTLLRPQDDVAGTWRLLGGLTELARHASPYRLSLELHDDQPVTVDAAPAPVADVRLDRAPSAAR